MRILGPAILVLVVVVGAIALQAALREELTPPPPIWSRPLAGPWDGSPDAPSLVEGCRRLLLESREGDWGALGRLDRRLHALARDRGGEHPLAHVDAWRDLLRSVRRYEAFPAPGVHRIEWKSDLPGRGLVRYAVRIPGSMGDGPVPVILSLPAPGEDAADHLASRWGGDAEGVLLLAPDRPPEDVAHPGLLLAPLRHARERWPVDDDRIVLAGLAGQEEAAARLAASFADRFAGLVLGATPPPVFPRHENLGTLPVLRIGRSPLPEVTRWLRGGKLRRDPHPRRIDWRIGPERTEDRAWWLVVSRLAPGAEEASLRAEIRPGNRVRIRAEGVASLRVLLNDRLVDLDHPVTLDLGEDRIVTHVPTRSVRRLVDAVEALGDLSAVFPEFVDVRLDP